ncbi:MAG: glycosyl hydrolase, partial [Gammaproteobacteria bacterium]
VNDIKADLHDADTVYVVVDDHKSGDFAPYILKSTDRGRSWRSIAGNLPNRHIVWRVVQDHVKPRLLFAGTEFGVYFTIDGGSKWVKLGGAPPIPFRDLVIQTRENDLVGATFGRGFYVLDDYSALRQIDADMLRSEAALFPVRDARWYVPRRPLGCSTPDCLASQGDAFFVAPNPPFGAVFTYYLPQAVLSQKEQRRAREEPLEAAGKDTTFPGWEAVTGEAIEDAPMMVLTVRDAAGRIVRNVPAPATAGFHRVAWDLRYTEMTPWAPPDEDEPYTPPAGVMALPGSYTVTLSQRINGQMQTTGSPQSFAVKSIRDPVLAGPDQEQRLAFASQAAELRRVVLGTVSAIDEMVLDLDAVQQTLDRSGVDPALYAESVDIEQQALRLRDRLKHSDEQDKLRFPGPLSIEKRVSVAAWGKTTTVYGPTATQVSSLEIASKEYQQIGPQVRQLIDVRFVALKRKLDAAGVPWTPSRGVPVDE